MKTKVRGVEVEARRGGAGTGAAGRREVAGAGGAARLPKVLLVMNAYYEECEALLQGISRYQHEQGSWDLFIDDGGQAASNPDWLSSQPWDGVISRATTPALVAACARQRVPLVDLDDRVPFGAVAKIRPDNVAIGHMAAEDLHERGYRHLYFCGYRDTTWSSERAAGFAEALRLLGCAAGEFLLPHGSTLTPEENAGVVQQLAAWLRTLPRPAGVMAAHDLRGRQLLAAAQEAGLRVPEELAVLGVNDERARCELTVPPLSSIALDAARTGYLAAEQLARGMRDGAGTAVELRVEPVRVVTRQSTDSLAIPDRAIAGALALIRKEACQGVTVAEVLRRASVSRGRLERGFRRYLGRSPQAEIRRVQLARIKQLLIETDLPLKQIALLAGFEHVEYLSVSFKREVGETPGRYRAAARRTAGTGGRAWGTEAAVPTAA